MLPRYASGPKISPAPGSADRPLWSVMIPTFNCADTLERTLRSVLEQDPGPARMQMEVVDDCSTLDDPEKVIESVSRDRVALFRQPRNLGHVGNFNTCIERSRGRLIHILHGDDWVKPAFYETMQVAFEHDQSIGAAFCRAEYIGEQEEVVGLTDLEASSPGVLTEWLTKILDRQRVCTPSMVVRRDVYENLGGFDPVFTTAGEDWEMWVRIAACYPVWFEPEVLACYRVTRAGSLTGDARRTTRVVRDMRKACEVIEQRLPLLLEGEKPFKRKLTSARLFYAGWSLNYVQQSFKTLGIRGALPHLVEAFRCHPSRWTLGRIVYVTRDRPLDPS